MMVRRRSVPMDRDLRFAPTGRGKVVLRAGGDRNLRDRGVEESWGRVTLDEDQPLEKSGGCGIMIAAFKADIFNRREAFEQGP